MSVTPFFGSDTFPVNNNDVYGLVETLAVQNIRGLKSTNRIADAFYEYDVADGKVIEEAVVKMADRQAFTKVPSPSGVPSLSPLDPTLYVKYFNNWETSQFKTTIRRDDIRAIIANKGAGVEEVVSEILASLSEGEGYYDYTKMRDALKMAVEQEYAQEATAYVGGTPKNAKGIVFALRQMFNTLKATNDAGNVPAPYGVPVEDIRIAVSEDLLNLIDVTELANVFNLEKEALFGKLVVIPHDLNFSPNYILVYDRKAFGRATRIFDYTQDVLGGARYTNHFLTTERAYFYNGLYKAIWLDVSDAITAAKDEILTIE